MNTPPARAATPPPETPPTRRTRHNLGLTTIEMLIGVTITVVGVGLLTLAVTGNLREQTEQGQSSNAKNSLRRIVDNLNTQVQQGSMVAIRNANESRANILFIDEANALNVTQSTDFSNSDTLRFSSGRGSFRAGDEALMVNANGEAVLFTVSQDTSGNDAARTLIHSGCPNTIQYTPGTRVFKANTFAFALGSQISPDLTPDSLYQQRSGNTWEEVAYDLKTFNLRYGYTATDGSTRENLTQANASARADILPNSVTESGSEYRLSSLSLQMAQGNMIQRTYNASVPLQTSRLTVNTIKQCGLTASMTGTPAGGLQVIVNAPSTVTPAVTVTGPESFNQTVSATTPDAAPWNKLPSGQYNVTAPEQNVGDETWVPVITGSPANISSWSGSTVTVKYGPALGELTINVSGLPAGTNAPLTISAVSNACVSWAACVDDPNSSSEDNSFEPGTSRTYPTNPTLTLNLAPGQYTLGAGAVRASDGRLYAPDPTPTTSFDMRSRQPRVIDVTYAPVTGGLVVAFYGKPGGSMAGTIQGPGGFTQAITLPTGGSLNLPTASPGVYNVSGTNNVGDQLLSQTGVVYPKGFTTIAMRDQVDPYVCPNGVRANSPQECGICPDGNLVGPSGCPNTPSESVFKCVDGRDMPANGRCYCDNGEPSSAGGTCPPEPSEPIDTQSRCEAAVMCVDGPDRPIGSNLVVNVNGQEIYLDGSYSFEQYYPLPDGTSMSVEEILSRYPTVQGNLEDLRMRAHYVECTHGSCTEYRPEFTPPVPLIPEPDPNDPPVYGPPAPPFESPPPPPSGAPIEGPPAPTPPVTIPDPPYSPINPYPIP